MENSFAIRHYIPEQDVSHLSQMLTGIESIDCDGENTSEEYLRSMSEWPNFDPAHNIWVAEENGKLAGFGQIFPRGDLASIYVVVHPTHRRKGLGSQLLELTLHRAREIDCKNLLVYANERNEASNQFLSHHNFQPVGSSGSLRLSATTETPGVEFPQGFTLRKYSEVNDPLILLKALYDCYLGMWGHGHNDNPTEEERKSPRFLKFYDPENILLLFDAKDSILGICSLKSQGKKDEDGELSDILDGPGIIQEFREQSYQRPLVLAGIQHLRKTGRRPIILEFWGDNENALAIYQSLGLEMVNRQIAYHKEMQ